MPRLPLLIILLSGLAAPAVQASPLTVRAGAVTYTVDPETLKIDAVPDKGAAVAIMPALHAAEAAAVTRNGAGWRWSDAEGRTLTLGTDGPALRLTITAVPGADLSWPLPQATEGTWLVPDGEGMAYAVGDTFWRTQYAHEHCMGATASLSMPAWSHLNDGQAVTYALADGLESRLCLHDQDGLQGRLSHSFTRGAETVDLMVDVGAPDPLAPALFYRQYMKAHGQFVPFKAKAVPGLPRLFGAPQAYVWGDGRDLGFLDDLKALGIDRITISYDQDPGSSKALVGNAYLVRAKAMGYLAGPYESFDNGQPLGTADMPSAMWYDLYPSGCIIKADGQVMTGFANRGCEMSSEAIARHPGAPSPGSRYARHVADGASQLFVDVDAFGDFKEDFSPDHPMTLDRDRANRLARLGLAIRKYKLVLGSENVTAWSSGVAHYSHGTAQTHASAIWPLSNDKRFGGYWPPERPGRFFKPFTPTPDEARSLFGSADRLPLFEAAFHDSVVAADRWEFGMAKVAGVERLRFARALLYGTPTMWNLDRKELARVAPWLKAARDDFRIAHGDGTPVALTGFRWLSDDRQVQEIRYADGHVLTANFGAVAWQGLGPDCVRVVRRGKSTDLCPPADLPPFK
ncbi:glycoside hydrolase [Asticcacaulis solisilvae]|uniref:glycoside hydrolase n=1 Tax=Asticcacaulis solisilvae TaxID=1217274 RepID=UPI003FD77484